MEKRGGKEAKGDREWKWKKEEERRQRVIGNGTIPLEEREEDVTRGYNKVHVSFNGFVSFPSPPSEDGKGKSVPSDILV